MLQSGQNTDEDRGHAFSSSFIALLPLYSSALFFCYLYPSFVLFLFVCLFPNFQYLILPFLISSFTSILLPPFFQEPFILSLTFSFKKKLHYLMYFLSSSIFSPFTHPVIFSPPCGAQVDVD